MEWKASRTRFSAALQRFLLSFLLLISALSSVEGGTPNPELERKIIFGFVGAGIVILWCMGCCACLASDEKWWHEAESGPTRTRPPFGATAGTGATTATNTATATATAIEDFQGCVTVPSTSASNQGTGVSNELRIAHAKFVKGLNQSTTRSADPTPMSTPSSSNNRIGYRTVTLVIPDALTNADMSNMVIDLSSLLASSGHAGNGNPRAHAEPNRPRLGLCPTAPPEEIRDTTTAETVDDDPPPKYQEA